MEVEEQKFMALEGIQTWAKATIEQVARIEAANKAQFPELADADLPQFLANEARFDAGRQFRAERLLFLIAAHKLIEHIEWAKKLSFLDNSIFSEVDALSSEIKTMRDLNEHAVEYFIGRGRFPEKWEHITEEAFADASSTINDRIGNRLSWNEVAAAAKALLSKLPPHYWPKRE